MGRVAIWFDRLVGDSRWWPLKIGLLVLLVSALHAVPPYDLVLDNDAGGNRLKGQHPLTHLTHHGLGDPRSHEAKLDFRFVVPLLLRPFNGSYAAAAVLYAAAGVALFGLMALVLRRCGLPNRTIALALFGVAVTPVGGIFLVSLDYFDAVAIALSFAAAFPRTPALSAALAFMALYTDERALVALLLTLGVATVLRRGTPWALGTGLTVGSLGVAAVAYAITRVALDVSTDLRTERAGVGLGVVVENLDRWPTALAAGFGVWWGIIVWGVARRRHDRPLFAAAWLGAAASAVLVDDVTRSLAYSLPLVPLLVVTLADRIPVRRLDRSLAVAAGMCFLTPTLVMAGPIGRSNPLVFHLPRWLGLV